MPLKTSWRSHLTEQERQLSLWVDESTHQAVDLLEEVVNINSGTMNHTGVSEVGQIFARELALLGFENTWHSLEDIRRAGHLFSTHPGNIGKRLLLIGHLDTVFEQDSPFQRFGRQGNLAVGPGAIDMKGGDVVAIFALKALAAAGVLQGADITVALMGDEEETGEPLSRTRAALVEAADRSHIALGFETSGPNPRCATVARRGCTTWELSVQGESGHSSRIFDSGFGAGAIFETSRILAAFYETFHEEELLSVSPGIAAGGSHSRYSPEQGTASATGKINVIPRHMLTSGDLRCISPQQNEDAKARMQEIVNANLPETKAEVVFRDTYPLTAPTPGNHDLMNQIDRISQDLGYSPMEALHPSLRGAADISFAGTRVEASLDGLGPAGCGDHSFEETVDLTSLPICIKRAALLIHRLTTGARG